MENVNESQANNEPTNGAAPEASQQVKPKEPAKPKEPPKPEVIIIRMWPKVPVLYPMAILALICALVGVFAGSTPHVNALHSIYQPAEQAVEADVSGDSLAAGIDKVEAGVDAAITKVSELASGVVDQAVVLEQSEKLVDGLYWDRLLGTIFLLVFAFSLFTLSVDLEVRWALVSFASLLIVCLLLIMINQRYDFLPGVFSSIASLSPMANPQFYMLICLIWILLMVISLFIVRFHYVRVESNEILVVGGLLERQQRFPTMRMRYTRDIQDVFEYYLPFVRSGRLILSFAEQHESIVIDNVLNIDKVTKQLDRISGVMKVKEQSTQ